MRRELVVDGVVATAGDINAALLLPAPAPAPAPAPPPLLPAAPGEGTGMDLTPDLEPMTALEVMRALALSPNETRKVRAWMRAMYLLAPTRTLAAGK